MVLKEDKEFAINGKQKDSVRAETSVVSGTMKINVKPTSKTAPPLNHQNQEVEVHREKGAPEARVHLGSSLDSRAKTT